MKPIKDKKSAVLPFNTERINGHCLVSNILGAWAILKEDEFKDFHQFSMDGELSKKLYESGIIVDSRNLPKIVNDFRNLNSHLFADASLHIAVVTTQCNLSCRYCQTKVQKPQHMDFKVASKILELLSEVRSPYINLEFQGGEPLLNWEIVKFFVRSIRNSKLNKNILISLVTNGTLLDEEKIKFLVDNSVSICISLDGPEFIHNKNRVFGNKKGSYKKVITVIKKLKKIYKQKKIKSLLDLLPTNTKYSLNFPKQIIDEYVSWGVDVVSLRPVNEIGCAKLSWSKLGYSPEEFNKFWQEGMDYVLELNKTGIKIKERMASIMLKKILAKRNPGYVDLMSPCGAGRTVLTYMPDGNIYPCDEARMAGEDIFKLGNLKEGIHYEEIIKKSDLFSITQASLIDLWDYDTAFFPWIGTCPVMNYMLQRNLIPKISLTPYYKIYHFQFRYLFKKMIEDKENERIFWGWVD